MKKYRPRIYYTEADKALMWDRWQKGESQNAIARLFDRHQTDNVSELRMKYENIYPFNINCPVADYRRLA